MHSGASPGDLTVVPSVGDPVGASFASRLQRARRRGFVGREDELDRFRRTLAGEDGTRPVLFVHGPPGVGKTSLLDRFAAEAQDAGRPVVRLGAAELDDLEGVGATSVLLVDGLEQAPQVQERLRERVLPGLSCEAVVVVAGRDRPAPEWYADPGWRALVEVRRLDRLDEPESRELLASHDVGTTRLRDLLGFAAGSPLALCLAAADDTDGDTETGTGSGPGSATGARWAPSRRLVGTLLDRVLDPVPDARHDLALRVGAHARHVTVEVLRTVLGEDEATEAFAWLGGLPFVEATEHGLRVDDLVGRLLDSDHHWRDPAGYEAVHRALWRHLAERVQDPGREPSTEAAADLLHLQRYRHPERHSSGGLRRGAEQVRLDDDVAGHVTALAQAHLGPGDRALVRRWLERDPDAFTVVGAAGRPTSFVAWLRLVAPEADDLDADPVLAAAWERASQDGPPGAGEESGLVRFVVPRPRSSHLDAEDPRLVAVLREVLVRRGSLASTYVALPDPAPCVPVMATLDHGLVAEVAGPDGSAWGLFGHDWRSVGLPETLARVEPPVGVGPPERARPTAWTRESFDLGVRQALRDFTDPEAFAANELVRAGVGAHLAPDDPVEAVRETLRAAVDRLAEDPRLTKAHRAVVATHLERSTTQEATAARLGMAFSTYRRHLARGTALVCDRAWSQSQGGAS